VYILSLHLTEEYYLHTKSCIKFF